MQKTTNAKKSQVKKDVVEHLHGKLPKIFVLDTNVLLHDHECIHKFQENDIVIPIVALEELDHFKKGNEQINFNARELARELDKIAGQQLFQEGVSLGRGMGRIRVALGAEYSQEMLLSFHEDTPDHRILAIALNVKNKNPNRLVSLVTKDVNLRLKANALGLFADDYLSDKVIVFEDAPKHLSIVKTTDEKIAQLFESSNSLSSKELKIHPHANEYFILEGPTSRVPVMYSPLNKSVNYVQKQMVSGIEARNEEQAFALDALMRPEIQLVALTGVAGTGKTLLALAAAIAQAKNFKQILLSRPVIPLQNQEMGFLPGDVNEKLAPYMLPLYDNLAVIKNKTKISQKEFSQIEDLQKTEALQITPLAYIRGRS
ncbi:MAG: PIN domain-containing protein, partial [Bacteroidales bacterium]